MLSFLLKVLWFQIYLQPEKSVYHSFSNEQQGNVPFSLQNGNKLVKTTPPKPLGSLYSSI